LSCLGASHISLDYLTSTLQRVVALIFLVQLQDMTRHDIQCPMFDF